MAGVSENGEMNPYISYVDLFSSVILTLLLFMLILFVNVGYYMQFHSKSLFDGKTEINTTQPENQTSTPSVAKSLIQKQIDINEERWEKRQKARSQKQDDKKSEQIEVIQQKTIVPIREESNITTSKFKGGQNEGNAIARSDKKKIVNQANFNEKDMVIMFTSNDIFLTGEIQSKVKKKLEELMVAKPNSQFEISVSDASKIISLTQSKQVSLGRILSLKNYLGKDAKLKDRVKLSLSQDRQTQSDFGYIKIEVK